MMGDNSTRVYTSDMSDEITNSDTAAAISASTAYPITRYEPGIGLCYQPSLLTLPHGSSLIDLAAHERRAYGAWRVEAAAYVAPDAAGRMAAIEAQIEMLSRELEQLRRPPVETTTAAALPSRAIGATQMRVGLVVEMSR